MRSFDLKKIPAETIESLYTQGKISHFDLQYYRFVTGQTALPQMSGEDVIAVRKELGITQEDLANLFGVTIKTVTRWEREEQLPAMPSLLVFKLRHNKGHFFDDLLGESDGNARLAQLVLSGSGESDQGGVCRPLRDDVPEVFDSWCVKRLRGLLKMNRREFAALLHVSLSSVDKWEQGVIVPVGATELLLRAIWRYGAGFIRN